ncbi:class I SAM-dependent methyltransferase [Alkalinema pantanalense CENA528]|uniref:class I SAM-dependent methyltransferase n=1 Tax=Alkalinema pantanalense TaxID=1620705 RepID=UPI003D6EBCD8
MSQANEEPQELDRREVDRQELRSRVQSLAQTYRDTDQPLAWFEALYASANGNPESIPWVNRQPHPLFLDWLTARSLVGTGRSALVVGCGLGDDAEALADRGFNVTAFDLSPTAIAWCRERFPQSQVDYQVADLFDLPSDWARHFDFVLEIYTIQAMPPELHIPAMQAIAPLVAPGGELLVICRGREETDPLTGPPFPLTRSQLATFEQTGLPLVEADDLLDPDGLRPRHFRLLYRAD